MPAGSARPLKPIEFARPTGMLKSGSAGPAPTAAPSPSVRDAKLEDRRTAHARFAAGDYASALGASQRVLAGAPDDAAMRKIATASACATGATDTASELAASAPLALRDDLVLQCAKFGVTLDIKPATRTRQAPPRPAKS